MAKIVSLLRVAPLLLAAFALDASGASLLKGPYLIYPSEETKIRVLWQTDGTPFDSSIEWWEAPTETSSSGSLLESGGGASEHQFSYTITGLKPGTHYHYRILVDSDERSGSFLTAPSAASDTVTIYGYGDSRGQPAVHDAVIKRLLTDVAADPMNRQTISLHTGDLVNDGDLEDDWDAHYFNRSHPSVLQFMSRMPVVPCRGNHEGSGELLQKYFPYGGQNGDGYHYSFDYGPVHVTVVDQYVDFAPGSAQYSWLESDLAGSDRPWKFVVFHEPAWSAGGNTNDKNSQEYLSPLFEQYGVAIVVSGHNHYYARCVVNNVQYITTGGGGVPLDDYELGSPSVVMADKSHHFVRYEIFKKQLITTAIREDGSVIESFAIWNDGDSISLFLKGDSNGDGIVGLEDAIVAMQVISGANQADAYTAADVNGDNKIGLAEAIYAMQTVAACCIPGIVINEVLAHSHTGEHGWIELYNPTGDSADIGGWYLSDDGDNLTKYEIAAGTLVPAGGYKVFYQYEHFGAAFTLSENGDTVYLSSTPIYLLTGYRKKENFGASERNVAFGRYEKSTGTFNFVAMRENTPGTANAYPKVGPVVINEIMYHPESDSENEEYIELYNITGLPVVLQKYDAGKGEIAWRFTDGIEYAFPLGTTIPAYGYLLVVKDRTSFKATYTVDGVAVLGPYDKQLRNGGEKVEISMPGGVDELGERQYIRVDRVNYDNEDPWPTGPDGAGSSLTRKQADEYGNDVINWDANSPTPGR